jgi:hypothetical protein
VSTARPKRNPRPIPGYTLSEFLLERCFVAVTEPHRIKEHEDIMLPRVDARATARSRKTRRRSR